jgi:hypothetical protein
MKAAIVMKIPDIQMIAHRCALLTVVRVAACEIGLYELWGRITVMLWSLSD